MGTHLLVNLLYVSFAVINSKIIYLIVKSRKVEISVLLIIVFLPFSDVIFQKAIKTYYELYKMEAKVFDYPQKDINGKIESLDLTYSSELWLVPYVDNGHKFNMKQFLENSSFDKRVKDFLEIKIPDLETGNRYLRISFNENPIKVEFIKNGTARYKINIQSKEKFFGFFEEINYQLIDRKRDNKLLIELSTPIFQNIKDNFRNKYLLWGTKKEEIFRSNSINNKEIVEKILKAGNI